MRYFMLLLACAMSAPALAGQAEDIVAAARAQIGVTLRYDGSYQRIAYPGGDVPLDRGVCTDVVIRAYRGIGIDLQKLVHEDMSAAGRADRNIDHRRVPNLAAFFRRHGSSIAPTRRADDYRPGDIVAWRLPGGLNHIGIVADRQTPSGTPLVIHNIGAGAQMEDVLFAYEMTGHYRYLPKR